MHFAAYCYVGESVADPLKYYLNNSAATMHLLKAMLDVGVKQVRVLVHVRDFRHSRHAADS
jgi:UDP-glucose 4-epimerase